MAPPGETMKPFRLNIDSADVRSFWVLLDFESDEHLTLTNAFVSREEDDKRKRRGGGESPKVVIRNARGANGR